MGKAAVLFAFLFGFSTALATEPESGDSATLAIEPTPTFAQDQFQVEIKLLADNRLVSESEVAFLDDRSATIFSGQKLGADEVEKGISDPRHIRTLVIIRKYGEDFERPEGISEGLWPLLNAEMPRFSIRDLEFRIFAPGADLLALDVDRFPAGSGAAVFYGSLESAYHCELLPLTSINMLHVNGFKGGRTDLRARDHVYR